MPIECPVISDAVVATAHTSPICIEIASIVSKSAVDQNHWIAQISRHPEIREAKTVDKLAIADNSPATPKQGITIPHNSIFFPPFAFLGKLCRLVLRTVLNAKAAVKNREKACPLRLH